MKKNIFYSIICVSLILVGCSEDFLNPERNDNILNDKDFEKYPELAIGLLNGISNFMIEDQTVTEQHYDFGQKGVDIWLDMLVGDMALSASGYGWYNSIANLIVTTDETQDANKIIWNYYYKVIGLSNDVIVSSGGNDVEPETPELRRILGQAKASRAYAYFYLTQTYQRVYNPTQAILPYYDGETTEIGKVPASQIYDLIIRDLTHALDLLDGYSRSQKNQINKDIVHGLLAYTYGAMGNYPDAKIHANAVVDSGAYPLTTTGQLAYPGVGSGFNDVNTPSWMWGFDLTEELGHQLIDWWGQIDYFTYSYAAFGDNKCMDDGLYAQIPDNDIRKKQFATAGQPLMPINKFFDPARIPAEQYIITTDLIFMRVEEFYLLSAEAAAKTGDEGAAKATLIEFLIPRLGDAAEAEAYVNPLSGTALIDAIYLQTRIEMWGEGKTYLAMKRNKKTVTRGTNHVFRAGESFEYDSKHMSFLIPRSELDNNPAMDGQND